MAIYLWTLCNLWYVCWIMYDLGCMLTMNRDPLWYSTYYQVYMGSSMIVRLLTGYHCTCVLISWTVLIRVSIPPCCRSDPVCLVLRAQLFADSKLTTSPTADRHVVLPPFVWVRIGHWYTPLMLDCSICSAPFVCFFAYTGPIVNFVCSLSCSCGRTGWFATFCLLEMGTNLTLHCYYTNDCGCCQLYKIWDYLNHFYVTFSSYWGRCFSAG